MRIVVLATAGLLGTGLIVTSAVAQPRNGNVYDGTAHQPTAGVRSEERSAGVAAPRAEQAKENHDLDVMGKQLMNRAHQDATSVPSVGRDVYGHLPDGSIQSTPNAGR